VPRRALRWLWAGLAIAVVAAVAGPASSSILSVAPLGTSPTAAHVPSARPLSSLASSAEPPGRPPIPARGGPGNVEVSANCSNVSNAEVEQAYDPASGNLYEAWIGCGGIGFGRSTDLGYSFEDVQLVLGSAGNSWDPSVAVAPNGTVYVGYMANNGSGDAPYVAWSLDHGRSFAGESTAFVPNRSEFSDRDFLAVAPNGTVYLTWDYSPNASLDQVQCAAGGSCYFTAGDYNAVLERSTDGGRNWSAPVAIDPEYPDGGAPAAPLLVEPNGRIDVLYEDYNVSAGHQLTTGRNFFASSTDGGATFSAPVPASNLTFPNSDWWINGALARDSSGTLYATFDAPSGGYDSAWATVSRSDGATWSAPIALNPDTDSAPHILAEGAGGENGTAYVVWMSNNSTSGWSFFEATLGNNGSSLSSPIRVSDQFGLNGVWTGDTVGASYLGGGRVAVSFGLAEAQQGGSPYSQIYAAVLGVALPGPPAIDSIVPGAGTATVGWRAPSVGQPFGGYVLAWAPVSGNGGHLSRGPGTLNATVTSLAEGVTYRFLVAALNTAGQGPWSVPRNLTLFATGTVAGTVSPPGAQVALDGVPLPVRNGSFVGVSTPGVHYLTASSSGFESLNESLLLPWNDTLRENVSLTPATGYLEGYVRPASATVSWDGTALAPIDHGFYLISGLGGSTHRLRVSAPAHLAYTANVTLVGGEDEWRNVTLLPENGSFALVVAPAWASVTVNARPIHLDESGRAGVTGPPGVYEVVATAPEYDPAYANVTVAAGQSVDVSLDLHLLAGPPSGGTTGSGGLGPFHISPTNGAILALLAVALGGLVLLAVLRNRRPPRLTATLEPADPDQAPNEGRVASETDESATPTSEPTDGPVETFGPEPVVF
jgi:hypothetical protein